MTELFRDRYKIGLSLASLFFLGIIFSVYSIYSIPHNLQLGDGYQSALTGVYTTLGFTFVIGVFTIWFVLNHRNEIIVFRDRQADTVAKDTDNSHSGQTTISLEDVKANVKQARAEKDVWQAGIQTICKQLEAGQGAMYVTMEENGIRKVELQNGYALAIGESTVISYDFGEGLIGQTAVHGKTLYIDDVPEGYIKIVSGLGSASPRFLLIVPVKIENRIFGVMEIASFAPITEDQRKFAEESAQIIAIRISENFR